MKANLTSLDPDNDGYVEFKQIEEALTLYFHNMKLSRNTTILWALFTITCLIFLGVTFGLVYLVVDLHKDASSVANQLVSRSTGQPLQTASTEFVIQNGIMTQRPSASPSRRGDTAGASDVKLLPFSATLSALSSSMSLEQLSALTWLRLSRQAGGGAATLAVDGFALVPAPGLPGGRYVVFQTAAGQLVLNGTDLSPAPERLGLAELFALAFPSAAAAGRGRPLDFTPTAPGSSSRISAAKFPGCVRESPRFGRAAHAFRAAGSGKVSGLRPREAGSARPADSRCDRAAAIGLC